MDTKIKQEIDNLKDVAKWQLFTTVMFEMATVGIFVLLILLT